MTVCNFFLQGRCRYGDKCWNEHPRGGRGGEYRGNQQPSRGGGGGGGFGNRVWINPSQRGSGEYIQPSSFSGGGGGGGGGRNDWGRGGGASRDVKSSDFSFSSSNRFSSLNTHSGFEKAGQHTSDENAKHLETIQTDMEIWQTSGQWPFSCYSAVNGQISGFVELSPEELRLEYYNGRASGDLQAYVTSVQQLANQWRSRVQELRSMSGSTQISVISELSKSSSQTPSQGFGSSGFGSTAAAFTNTSSTPSGFGAPGFGSASQSSSTFSFASSKTDFGASNAQPQAPGFGSPAFAQPPAGFGAQAPSAASFSFAAAAVESKPSSGGFGAASGFSFKSSSTGLGSGFGSVDAGSADAGRSGALFTARSELSPEELKEFTSRRFTLGQIPLRPPPADLLSV